jgi:hypothetical protein
MRIFLASFAICVGIPAAVVACRNSDAAGGPSPAPASSPAASTSGAAEPAPSASTSGPVANVTFPMPQSALDAVLNPDHLPAYDGPTGSLEGTITVKGPAAPDVKVDVTKCPAALDTYGKLFREGHPDTPGGPRWLADAVVVVFGYKGYLPEKNDAVKETIGAASCAYPSRTIALTYGQRLEIANETKLLFAPVIDQESTPAVMVAPPGGNGDPVRVYPRRAGYFNLTDRIQLFVRQDLYVFRHPLHAVSDTSGHYRIDGLPVGKLEVGVHHPTVDADARKTIEVVAGVVQRVDLELTYKPKPPAKVVDSGLPPKRLQND